MSSAGSSQTAIGVHRRKSSRDEDDNVLIFPLDGQPTSAVSLAAPPKGNRVDADASDSGSEHEASGSRPNDVKAGAVPKANGTEHGGWGARSQFTSSRSRVTSVPAVPSPLNGQFPAQRSPPNPPSAGPYRTSFALPRPSPANGAFPHVHAPNGHGRHQAPAMRQSLSLPAHSSHARARSVSGPFSPSSPSPLATSFSIPQSASYPPIQGSDGNGLAYVPAHSDSDPASSSPPKRGPFNWGNGVSPLPAPNTQSHTRRHSRLHSRNLSIFFPRPGSLPSTAIDEDGSTEVEVDAAYSDDDGVLIPPVTSAGPGQHSFRQGFTFGGKPPPDATDDGFSPVGPAPPSGPAKRGHHHKHSVSHNFFSFLEPGGAPRDLQTHPTPMPVSPWNPISPFPFEKSTSGSSLDRLSPVEGTSGIGLGVHTAEKSPIAPSRAEPEVDPLAAVAAVGQFVLGATLWVVGQQVGSLSCTGLGYWVVFDAFGVSLAHVLPGYLARPQARAGMRRPYGYVRNPLFHKRIADVVHQERADRDAHDIRAVCVPSLRICVCMQGDSGALTACVWGGSPSSSW